MSDASEKPKIRILSSAPIKDPVPPDPGIINPANVTEPLQRLNEALAELQEDVLHGFVVAKKIKGIEAGADQRLSRYGANTRDAFVASSLDEVKASLPERLKDVAGKLCFGSPLENPQDIDKELFFDPDGSPNSSARAFAASFLVTFLSDDPVLADALKQNNPGDIKISDEVLAYQIKAFGGLAKVVNHLSYLFPPALDILDQGQLDPDRQMREFSERLTTWAAGQTPNNPAA